MRGRVAAAPRCLPATPVSPSVYPDRELMQRHLIGAGVGHDHYEAVRVTPLHRRDLLAAASLGMGGARFQYLLGPGQVVLPGRRPDDVLGAHAPESVSGVGPHGSQDEL